MTWVSDVNVNEKTLVVNNDYVVHQICFFYIIEPSFVCPIIPQLVDFHQTSTNEPNATQEVLDSLHQGNLLFDSQPLNLIHNSFINAW